MRFNLKITTRKIWLRVSGKESRNLWNELTSTQSDLASRNDRHLRLHPYVAEALKAIAPPIETLKKI